MSTSLSIEQFTQSWLGRQSWLTKQYHQHILRRAIFRAYAIFSRDYPEWTDYLFDEYFLTHRAAPYLQRYPLLQPAELVQAWAEQLFWRQESLKQKHMAALMPAAASFLRLLESELRS